MIKQDVFECIETNYGIIYVNAIKYQKENLPGRYQELQNKLPFPWNKIWTVITMYEVNHWWDDDPVTTSILKKVISSANKNYQTVLLQMGIWIVVICLNYLSLQSMRNKLYTIIDPDNPNVLN